MNSFIINMGFSVLSTFVLPHDRIAVVMYCTFGHIRIVVMLQVYGVFEEIIGEQSGVDPFCSGRFFIEREVAIEAEVILFFDILFSDLSSLLWCEGCIIYWQFVHLVLALDVQRYGKKMIIFLMNRELLFII